MGVYTFVLRNSGGEWTGKQSNGGDIEASAPSRFEIERKLVHSVQAVDSSGGVQSSFSPISPTSAVFQVVIGGAVFVGGGGGGAVAAAAAPAAAGGNAPAAESKKEEKKVEEEEEDEDFGMSLFD